MVKLEEQYIKRKEEKVIEEKDVMKDAKKKKAELLADSWKAMVALLEEIERNGEEWELGEQEEDVEDTEEELETKVEKKRKKKIIAQIEQ